MGLEVSAEMKDFLMGFPTLKHRNMGGFLLFSSDEKSISAGRQGEGSVSVSVRSLASNR